MARKPPTPKRGRPTRESSPLPPHVQKALQVRGQGSTWKAAAESVDMDPRNLREWVKHHPQAEEFLKDSTQDALDRSYSKLIAAAPEVSDRLLGIIRDKKTRPYITVDAIDLFFRVIDKGYIDRAQEEKLELLSEKLAAIEGNRVIDV